MPVLQPIVKALTQPALAEYRRIPAATRREVAVDSIASVLTANKFYSKIEIPRGTNTARFSNQWVDMKTSDMTRPGYLKAYLEVRAQVTKALADDAKP